MRRPQAPVEPASPVPSPVPAPGPGHVLGRGCLGRATQQSATRAPHPHEGPIPSYFLQLPSQTFYKIGLLLFLNPRPPPKKND